MLRADVAEMAGGATPQSADSMTAQMQQERRRRRQTDRESLEQIRKRHLEASAVESDAVPVPDGGLCASNCVPQFVCSSIARLRATHRVSNWAPKLPA